MIRNEVNRKKLTKLFERIDDHSAFGKTQKNYLKKVLRENVNKSFRKH